MKPPFFDSLNRNNLAAVAGSTLCGLACMQNTTSPPPFWAHLHATASGAKLGV